MNDQQQADVVDKMIRSAGKFDGTGFDEWLDHAKDCFSMRCPGVADIIDGRPCPEAVVRKPRGRPKKSAEDQEEVDRDSTSLDDPPAPSTDTDITPAAASPPVPTTEGVASSILWDLDDSITNQDEIRKWHTDNRMLGTFLSMCTTGAPKKFLNKFKPKKGMMSNGIVAWEALVKKYRNPSRQRQRILTKKLMSMTMDDDQDPDTFLQDLSELRDELREMGTIFNDNQILDIILQRLPDLYSGIKYEAETKDDFDLEHAMYTMRNLYANRKALGGFSRSAKGRSSAMVASGPKWCTFCRKKGHDINQCFKKKPAGTTPGGRKGDWCTIHQTSQHDNSICREQQNRNYGGGGGFQNSRQQHGRRSGSRNRNNRYRNGDQPGGQHGGQSGGQNRRHNSHNSYNSNAPDGQHRQQGNYPYNGHQANFGHVPAVPTSTTMVNTYNPAGQHPPTSATAPSTAAPPEGVGFSFLAAHGVQEPVRFSMTVDTGASSHFVDSDLLPDVRNHMVEYTAIKPPLVIDVAGKGKLHGTAMGAMKVQVSDQQGLTRSIRLPFICVPTLGRHLFSAGAARKYGVALIFCKNHTWI